MKKFIIIFLFIIGGLVSQAQTTYTKGANGELIASTEVKTKTPDKETGMFVTIKDIKYPVYQGAKESYYIKRISKKSGKEYKSYIKIEE